MSHVPCGVEAGQLEPEDQAPSASRRSGVSYLALLHMPGAARFCISGMVGRAPMAMFGLGTVLLVAASTGHYALAGLVSGPARSAMRSPRRRLPGSLTGSGSAASCDR